MSSGSQPLQVKESATVAAQAESAWGIQALYERNRRNQAHQACVAGTRVNWIRGNRYYYDSLIRLLRFLILDADLSVIAEEFPYFLYTLASGCAEFVNGSRLIYPIPGAAMKSANMFRNEFFSWSCWHGFKKLRVQYQLDAGVSYRFEPPAGLELSGIVRGGEPLSSPMNILRRSEFAVFFPDHGGSLPDRQIEELGKEYTGNRFVNLLARRIGI